MPAVVYRSGTMTSQAIFDVVKAADVKKYVMTAACFVAGDSLVTGHAYSMLGAVKLSNGQQLMKMRNPWGKERYKGPYGDKDSRWTAALKREAGWTDANDGVFFIPMTNFKRSFTVFTTLLYQDW